MLPDPPPRFDAARILSIRRHPSLTQAGLALLLNISGKTVERWEESRRKSNGAAARFLQLLAAPEAPGRWLRDRSEASGRRNTQDDMRRLALEIVAKSLFDAEIAGEAGEASAAIERLLEQFLASQWTLRQPQLIGRNGPRSAPRRLRGTAGASSPISWLRE